MSEAVTLSIHDNVVLGYEVDGSKRAIKIRTKCSEPGAAEYINVLFRSVEAYKIENDCFESILYGIEEIDQQTLLNDQWPLIEAGFRNSGWPGPWAASLESAKRYLLDSNCRAFSIRSSFGMEGWVFSRTMDLEKV